MKKTILAAMILLISGGYASAQKYDRAIEQAAIEIVAAKMGEIRGGLDIDQKPVFVKPIDRLAPTYLGANRMQLIASEITASITR